MDKDILENWEEEFEKLVTIKYVEKFGRGSTNRLNWGCEECGGEDAENDIKQFISSLLQAQREHERARASNYLRKICWSEEDIKAFLDWGNLNP